MELKEKLQTALQNQNKPTWMRAYSESCCIGVLVMKFGVINHIPAYDTGGGKMESKQSDKLLAKIIL